ncbi:hypothetical protein COT94_01320 [Candidatus Falkowbacteria bacterium CG10_big_fil_rev_8_21_14_0_10_37_14]|uniref:Uncharacterized protein n=1 Tax=Candidatus Falkowbacteria bacterium CG10_big_fil_rev_8_21_14_0_10_37_14 TaxID=1974561 RepID=A0A2M6WU50_9BACT|nr:hypothetical protein [Candidatus Falkowbacteria bacterium]PIT96315.1 MAG: hypothetical protein COT94_01320 [Candidatus Falkowbacteria bacterium CG10_big_fil_rev_8_21_14_0_10_37_14]
MKTLLVVFLFLFFNGLLLSQTDFRLTRPADWNSTVNQVQLDFNGKLAEKVRDIPGTAKITLSADCDGVLDKMLNFRFPDATNFEKIDDTKWSFVDLVGTAGDKELTYFIRSRADDLDNVDHFFQEGADRILWESFIQFKKFPTKGKLLVEYTGVRAYGSGGQVSATSNFSYEINWGDNLKDAEFKMVVTVDWNKRLLLADWYYKSRSAIARVNLNITKPNTLSELTIDQLGPNRTAQVTWNNNYGTLEINAVSNPYPVSSEWSYLGRLTFPISGNGTGDLKFTNTVIFDPNGKPINIDPSLTIKIDWGNVDTKTTLKLIKPSNWNVVDKQAQLNVQGTLLEKFKSINAKVKITLLESNGILDKMLTFNFPGDLTKWSFVNLIGNTYAKELTYNIQARSDDLDNAGHFFKEGTEKLLWESFILFKQQPTQGRLRVEYSDVRLTNASDVVSVHDNFFYEIEFGPTSVIEEWPEVINFGANPISDRTLLVNGISVLSRGTYQIFNSAGINVLEGVIRDDVLLAKILDSGGYYLVINRDGKYYIHNFVVK